MSITALTQFQIDQLNGAGLPSPMGIKASEYLLGDRLAETRTEVDEIVAALTEEVVVEFQVPLLAGIAQTSAGTWTKAMAANGVLTVVRTASATDGVYWIEVPLPVGLLVNGFKPTGLKARYTVADATPDDVKIELHKKVPASNSEELCGAANADYNASENTAAERLALGAHVPVISVPSDEQEYLVVNEKLLVRVFVDADAGAAATVTLTDITVTGLTKVLDATPLT